MRSFWDISPFPWSKQHVQQVFPISSDQVMQNHHLVPKVKNPPKLGIICERYWLLNLAPAFEQHMETPQQDMPTQQKVLHA